MGAIILRGQYAHVPKDITFEELQAHCQIAAEAQKGVMWWIGDFVLASERPIMIEGKLRKLTESERAQLWPVGISPDMLTRCRQVAQAYDAEERNDLATWSIHMRHKNDPARVDMVQAAVDAGQTSDENRKEPAMPQREPEQAPEQAPEPEPAQEAVPEPPAPRARRRWLLAVDVSYYIHSFFRGGLGMDAVTVFVKWLWKVIRLLQKEGLTDVVVCFDGPNNHRKALTAAPDWPGRRYKERDPRPLELKELLSQAPDIMKATGLMCVSIDGMEADDVMASYAAQFPGIVTLLTVDKDMRQCLVQGRVNILKDCKWEISPDTGKPVPVRDWVNEQRHKDEGINKESVGIKPSLWPHFQALCGDNTDGVQGVRLVGAKLAGDCIRECGTVFEVIKAAHEDRLPLSIKKAARDGILEWEPLAETTLKLVTLRTDLPVPMTTTIPDSEDGHEEA